MTAASRVRFVTFGCKANQYDTQVLREALLRRGWSEEQGDADLVVINTCTVTAEAGRKARQLARRIHRETPAARIAMTGCLAESEPELLRELPGVEWVLGNGDAKRPVNFLRQIGEEVDPEELGIPSGITAFAGHTRAFLKIQDGCDMRCAFCIIPSVRGPSRSRPAEELEAELRRLLASGHREVVLCGIHIGHWGRERGSSLAALLRRLFAIELPGGEDWRLRLSSIEATEVDDALLAVLAEHGAGDGRVALHLHMPLQAGDDELLRAMRRWYDARTYLAACDRIRDALDRPAFTADVIVGFPGETDARFENTLDVVRAAGFARLHVFPWSARPGTAAAGLGGAPDKAVVRERRVRLSELAAELGDAWRRGLAGARDAVVLEGWSGLSGRYQQVRVDPASWPDAGLPPAVLPVELAVEEDADGGARLVGRPLAGLARRAAEALA